MPEGALEACAPVDGEAAQQLPPAARELALQDDRLATGTEPQAPVEQHPALGLALGEEAGEEGLGDDLVGAVDVQQPG